MWTARRLSVTLSSQVNKPLNGLQQATPTTSQNAFFSNHSRRRRNKSLKYERNPLEDIGKGKLARDRWHRDRAEHELMDFLSAIEQQADLQDRQRFGMEGFELGIDLEDLARVDVRSGHVAYDPHARAMRGDKRSRFRDEVRRRMRSQDAAGAPDAARRYAEMEHKLAMEAMENMGRANDRATQVRGSRKDKRANLDPNVTLMDEFFSDPMVDMMIEEEERKYRRDMRNGGGRPRRDADASDDWVSDAEYDIDFDESGYASSGETQQKPIATTPEGVEVFEGDVEVKVRDKKGRTVNDVDSESEDEDFPTLEEELLHAAMMDMAMHGGPFGTVPGKGKKRGASRKKTTMGQRRKQHNQAQDPQHQWSGVRDANDRDMEMMLQQAIEEAQREERLLREAMRRGGDVESEWEGTGQSLNMEDEWRRRVLQEEMQGLYDETFTEAPRHEDKGRNRRSKKAREASNQARYANARDSDGEVNRGEPYTYEEVDFSDSEEERAAFRNMDDDDKARFAQSMQALMGDFRDPQMARELNERIDAYIMDESSEDEERARYERRGLREEMDIEGDVIDVTGHVEVDDKRSKYGQGHKGKGSQARGREEYVKEEYGFDGNPHEASRSRGDRRTRTQEKSYRNPYGYGSDKDVRSGGRGGRGGRFMSTVSGTGMGMGMGMGVVRGMGGMSTLLQSPRAFGTHTNDHDTRPSSTATAGSDATAVDESGVSVRAGDSLIDLSVGSVEAMVVGAGGAGGSAKDKKKKKKEKKEKKDKKDKKDKKKPSEDANAPVVRVDMKNYYPGMFEDILGYDRPQDPSDIELVSDGEVPKTRKPRHTSLEAELEDDLRVLFADELPPVTAMEVDQGNASANAKTSGSMSADVNTKADKRVVDMDWDSDGDIDMTGVEVFEGRKAGWSDLDDLELDDDMFEEEEEEELVIRKQKKDTRVSMRDEAEDASDEEKAAIDDMMSEYEREARDEFSMYDELDAGEDNNVGYGHKKRGREKHRLRHRGVAKETDSEEERLLADERRRDMSGIVSEGDGEINLQDEDKDWESDKEIRQVGRVVGGEVLLTFDFNEKDLDERFVYGSGPGGQATNKTRNCVWLQHMPTGTIVKCHQTRSLFENRMIARKIMKRKLESLKLGKNSYIGRKQERVRRRKDRNKRRHQKKMAEKLTEGLDSTVM